MKTEYYIPNANEFYEGFEYECCKCLSKSKNKIILDNIFAKYKFDVYDFLEHDDFFLDRCISDGMVRVKYLDKEDIESLGFTQTIEDQYCKDDFELLIDDDLFIQIIKDDGFIFQGTIKNKSELKKLLIQSGIINE